jgi:hypothetical protein
VRSIAWGRYRVIVITGSGEAALVEIDEVAHLAAAMAGVRRTAPDRLAEWRYHGIPPGCFTPCG